MSERLHHLLPCTHFDAEMVVATVNSKGEPIITEQLPVIGYYVSGGHIEAVVTVNGPYPFRSESDALMYQARALKLTGKFYCDGRVFNTQAAFLEYVEGTAQRQIRARRAGYRLNAD